jgi:hypothetical protein
LSVITCPFCVKQFDTEKAETRESSCSFCAHEPEHRCPTCGAWIVVG